MFEPMGLSRSQTPCKLDLISAKFMTRTDGIERLLVGHDIDEVHIIDSLQRLVSLSHPGSFLVAVTYLQVKVPQVPVAGWSSEGYNILHGLLFVLIVQLLEESNKVLPVISDTATVISTWIFLYLCIRSMPSNKNGPL